MTALALDYLEPALSQPASLRGTGTARSVGAQGRLVIGAFLQAEAGCHRWRTYRPPGSSEPR